MRSSRRQLATFALGLGGLVLLAALMAWFSAREPRYDGRPISAWIDDLAGPVNPTYGAVASDALPKLLQEAPGAEIVPALAFTLRRGRTTFDRFHAFIHPRLPKRLAAAWPPPDPARASQLRYRAALILYYLGPEARRATRQLVESLKDSEEEVRRVVTNALGNMEPQPKVTAALRMALSDPAVGVRRAALQSIRTLEPEPVVVRAAANLLADSSPGVRIDAAQLLKDLGAASKPVIPALIAALQDANDDVLRFAAQALGRIGPEARESVPALIEALDRNRPYTETTIRWALQQIDPYWMD